MVAEIVRAVKIEKEANIVEYQINSVQVWNFHLTNSSLSTQGVPARVGQGHLLSSQP